MLSLFNQVHFHSCKIAFLIKSKGGKISFRIMIDLKKKDYTLSLFMRQRRLGTKRKVEIPFLSSHWVRHRVTMRKSKLNFLMCSTRPNISYLVVRIRPNISTNISGRFTPCLQISSAPDCAFVPVEKNIGYCSQQ